MLTAAWRSIHKHPSRRRDAYSAEYLWMAQRQLHQLPDLRQLSATSADVVVAHLMQALVVTAAQRAFLQNDLGVRTHSAVFAIGITITAFHGYDFEFYGAHASACDEDVAEAERTILAEEVRLHEHIEEVAAQSLDGVLEGHNHYFLRVFDVG